MRGGQNWDQIFSNKLTQFIIKSTQNHNLNEMNYSMTKFFKFSIKIRKWIFVWIPPFLLSLISIFIAGKV